MANIAQTNVCNETLDIIAEGLRTMQWEETVRKLTEQGSALQVSLAQQGNKRWKPFAGFKRFVDGQLVMSAPEGIVRDLPSGPYPASSLAQYSDLSREYMEP